MSKVFSRSVRALIVTLVALILRSGVQTEGAPSQGAAPAAQAAAAAREPELAPFLNQYCITCHNQRLKTGSLALDALDVSKVGADADTWEKVVRKIRTGMMPPSGARRPERSALDAFAGALDPNAALATPALHRLNRTEYANAIRDLLALDVDVDTLLPADGSSQGFDNLAEALAASPALIQGYVSAAMKISRLAVGDRTMSPVQLTFNTPPGLAQDRHIDGLPLGTRGGMLIHHFFPVDADYDFSFGGRGFGLAGGVDITLDGQPIKVDNPRSFKLKVAAGPHTIGLAVLDRQRGAGVDEIYSDFRSNAAFTTAGGVPSLVITGPTNITGPG